MATRFYLPTSGTPPLGSLAVDSQWELTDSLTRLPTFTTKQNTSLAQTSATWSSATTQQWVWRQWQSKPMTVAYDWTTSDTVSMVIKVAESIAQGDSHLCYVIRVVSGDGATVRGTIGSYLTTSTEYPTSLGGIATRIHDARTNGATNFSSQVGDRIIIEIGHHGVTPSTSATVYHNYGDPSGTADYALTADLTTDLCPWVELSRTVSFDYATSTSKVAYTKGQIAGTTSKQAFTQGPYDIDPAITKVSLQIANITPSGTPTSDNQSAYTGGQSVTSSSKSAYTKGLSTISDSKSAYMNSVDYGITSKAAFLFSAAWRATSGGIIVETRNVPSIRTTAGGVTVETRNVPSIRTTAGGITVEWIYSKSSSKAAYLNGVSAGTDVSDNQSAYLAGSASTSSSVHAFTLGQADSLDAIPAYSSGQAGTSASTLAFTKGQTSTLDNKSVYTKGQSSTSDNQFVYTKGTSTFVDNQSAFVKGQSFHSGSQNAYTSGINSILDSQYAFIHGLDLASDFINGYIEGTGQYLIPDSDIITGSWQNELGGSGLYASVADNSDSTYDWYDTAISGAYFEVGLSNPGTIIDGVHYFIWRAYRKSGTTAVTLKCEVRQGSGIIIASDTQTLFDTVTEYHKTLTPDEVSNITDFNDLRMRITIVGIE